MTIWMAAAMMCSAFGADLPSWTFDADAQGWVHNEHLANVEVKDGKLCADAIDWDPMFVLSETSFEATPWQYVLLKIRASRPGQGDLFWTGQTEGQYGGFSEKKRTSFSLNGAEAEDVVIFPFWQGEGTIRKLRLDVYDHAHFEIDSIQILSWGEGAAPATNTFSWTFNGDVSSWRVNPAAEDLFAPPLNLAVKDKAWVSIVLQSDREGTASFLWSPAGGLGVRNADFVLRKGPKPRTYNIELEGQTDWKDSVAAVGLRLPREGVRLTSLALAAEPSGPPDIDVVYFGFENAVNRADGTTPCRVAAQVINLGGSKTEPFKARLVLPPELRFSESAPDQEIPGLNYGETASVGWNVKAGVADDYTVWCKVGPSEVRETKLTFTDSLQLPKADYVPAPRPVVTEWDVCAYYFPGWDADSKWDCIRRVAPIRKPALGYYVEGNPECVDWQIKWAVENGINCFLVDWYWCQGAQHLTHWFEAYRKARYRDMLKVAIMWANHNPPNTHSPEDWHKVTQEWIDNYFTLPAYYRIDGKPVVFIWAPSNLRNDLKNSETVKKCMDESQDMAKQAGYPGIVFVAMNSSYSKSDIQYLVNEGYTDITNYHEWGKAHDTSPNRRPYVAVARTSPDAWKEKKAQAGALEYLPVADTGWDSRPWHGDTSLVIEGRTPELFEKLLNSARAFTQSNSKKIVILGPVNEWGEGSYIEPCVEYGFKMYEAVRNVFASGNPTAWPKNFGPSDVGLGPYDYPPTPPVSAWTFDGPDCDWKPMMGVADLACGDGTMKFRTVSDDPAIIVDTRGIRAGAFSMFSVSMQLTGTIPENSNGQIFWCTDGHAVTEATSATFPLIADGQMHTYTIDLKANSRWRNLISTIRFDACNTKDIQAIVEEIRLNP